MKIFTKTYLNLLYENTGSIKFDLKLYNKFLNDCKKIDKFGNIINEDKTLLIDIPDELITYLIIIIVVAVLIKLFAWLLPILVVLAIAYVLYVFITEKEY